MNYEKAEANIHISEEEIENPERSENARILVGQILHSLHNTLNERFEGGVPGKGYKMYAADAITQEISDNKYEAIVHDFLISHTTNWKGLELYEVMQWIKQHYSEVVATVTAAADAGASIETVIDSAFPMPNKMHE